MILNPMYCLEDVRFFCLCISEINIEHLFLISIKYLGLVVNVPVKHTISLAHKITLQVNFTITNVYIMIHHIYVNSKIKRKI